jgi:hypothetical protein
LKTGDRRGGDNQIKGKRNKEKKIRVLREREWKALASAGFKI